jgi:Flp pilus assembly pilin Flp
MGRANRAVRVLFRELDGATAVEYALLITFALLVCIGGIRAIGSAVSGVFEQPLRGDSAKAGVAPAARGAVSPGTPRVKTRRP